MSEDKQSTTEPANGKARIRRIERTCEGRLEVYLTGRSEPVRDARIAKCFPWSMPADYISILDNVGKEVALLETLDDLDAASREIVEQELREKLFNPKITRVIEFKHEFGVTTITAETDRGEVSFQIRSRDDVRKLSPTRALFRDADGNTYELPDVEALDPASQKRLQGYF